MIFKLNILLCQLVLLIITTDKSSGQFELCKNFISTQDFDILRVGNKKMVYFTQERTWQQAFDQCQQLGMRLVSIENEEENKALFRFLHNRVWGKDRVAYDYTYWYMWSSGVLENEGNYVWKSNGQKVNYTSWGEGEPNGQDYGEKCIELRYITTENLVWNDSACSFKKRYICEKIERNSLDIE